MPSGESHWRRFAAPIIERVIAENAGKDESAVRLALREAYPFGERRHHPYKVWLDEVGVQLGKKLPPHQRGPAAKRARITAARDETIGDLFSEESL